MFTSFFEVITRSIKIAFPRSDPDESPCPPVSDPCRHVVPKIQLIGFLYSIEVRSHLKGSLGVVFYALSVTHVGRLGHTLSIVTDSMPWLMYRLKPLSWARKVFRM